MIRSMGTVMRRAALGGLVGLLLAAPGRGRAETLVLEFDLSRSTSSIVLNPGVLTASGQAVGSLKLTLNGVNSDGSLLGPTSEAFLSDLNLTLSSVTTIPGVPDFSARFEDRLIQTGTARGQFDGMRILFDAGQIAGQHDATTVCDSPICALVSISDRPDVAFANLGPFAIELTALGLPDSTDLRGGSTFPFTIGVPQLGQTILRLRGTDRRSSVPEPSPVGLLALAGLGVAALRRSGRAAQPRIEDA